MKNITVSVDDDTYRRARIKAAEQDTSVSALVRQFLDGLAAEDSSAQRELRERPRDFRGEDRPPGDTSRQRGRWDDLFDRGPRVSEDFMNERVQPEPEEREPF